MAKLPTNGLLAAASLTLTLLCGEVATRLVYRHSMDFDMEFWKYAREVKVVDADSGFGHRPNTRAFLMGVEVTTNRFGLRGPDATLEKPRGVYRVVALGDSLTMGWGVAQDRTYLSQLERMLNERPPGGFPHDVCYEVLNLGVGNYNTVQEVASLHHLGMRFNPDLILLGYFINDAEPSYKAREERLIKNSYLYAFVRSRLQRTGVGDLRRANYREYYGNLYAPSQSGWHEAEAALDELVKLGKEKQIPVVMYILPDLHELGVQYPFLKVDRTLVGLGRRIGLPVVDLMPAFNGHLPEESLWVSSTDAHPNAKAHAVIARAIYESLAAGIVKP